MFPHHKKLLTVCAALALSACATQQNPAPVVSGTDSSVYQPTSSTETSYSTDNSSNPYGATPYDPNASTSASTSSGTTTTTSTSSSSSSTSSGSASSTPRQPYVGNYSPVDVTSNIHLVQYGDTVYNISKRYGISQDNLRAWNNIGADNAIHLGQTLRVKPTGSTASTTTTTTTTTKQPTQPVNTAITSTTPVASWQAPTEGKIIQPFGNGNNGVDIGGVRGQAVVAAADGQVVYSGSGLRGYGNLVIIQHNNVYLTAYGHNEPDLLVKEGQRVKRGQQIAKMGNSDSSSGVKLHFEVRENGTPVNPTRFVKF